MRILWMTNIPVGHAGELFFGKKSNGLWMDAALNMFEKDEEQELFIATTGTVKNTQKKKVDRITYYLLPNRNGYDYRCGRLKNIQYMENMIDEICPEIIQIWGTENQTAIDLVQANRRHIPMVVYIQGVVTSLERYYTAGIPTKERLLNCTVMDFLKGTGYRAQMRRYRRQAEREYWLIKKVRNVIGENQWSYAYYKAISEYVCFYRCPLHINRAFIQVQWKSETMIPHSIMCHSAYYPIKGLHILLKAIEIVKRIYPDVTLLLPGGNPAQNLSWKASLKQTGYIKYIKKLIRKTGLRNSIEFLPFLSPQEMAKKMASANVFVVSSSIENHSSSLKEAMLVGTPSIGTYVGGVSEYVRHGENGFLYRFEEPEVLASLICDIFGSNELANRLSENGRADMMALHMDYDIHNRFIEIYQAIKESSQRDITECGGNMNNERRDLS